MSLNKRKERRIKGVRRANMKWYHWLFLNNWMLSAIELDDKYSDHEIVEVYDEFSLGDLAQEGNVIEIEDEYGDLYAIAETGTGSSYGCGNTDVEEEIEEILELEENNEIIEEVAIIEENNGSDNESFYGGDDNSSGGYDDGDSGSFDCGGDY